jgi:moderate conductance mechanosensitive channel
LLKELMDRINPEAFIDKVWGFMLDKGLIILAQIIACLILLKVAKFIVSRANVVILNHMKKKRNVRDIAELEKRANTLNGIIFSITKIVIISYFALIILKSVNINIAPLLAGAGILGIALGFGAQELIRDFISGFFILLENQVRTGDVAIINGTSGLVETIGLRTMTLRDLSGVLHVFQNGKINSLSNMTKDWSGIVFKIGVAYKENVDTVIELMKSVADELMHDEDFKDIIINDFEVFGLDDFSDSAVVIKARFKTIPIKQWMVGREYKKRLKAIFDKNNIEIPFPHRTIYWGKDQNINLGGNDGRED